jgi:Rieske Fe-S protein
VANGIPVSTVSAVQQQGFIDFTVPARAPANLFPTDPAVLIALPDGTFVAYDAICTHEGCAVDFDSRSQILFCPCHGAEFDATNHAKVLQGPARRPLPELPLAVDPVSGTISLAIG